MPIKKPWATKGKGVPLPQSYFSLHLPNCKNHTLYLANGGIKFQLFMKNFNFFRPQVKYHHFLVVFEYILP